MRCLALADELNERGAEIVFVTRAAEKPWGDLVREQGHQVAVLRESASDWATDAEKTRAVLADNGLPDWLVVDHYELGIDWEKAMRAACGQILAIDDIRRLHDSDVLLDQNIIDNSDCYRDRVPSHCGRILGPSYALLRREFREERAKLRSRDRAFSRVLISFGGSDPTGETEKAIQGFLAAGLGGVSANVVLGAANPRAGRIRDLFGAYPNVRLIPHTDHMAVLMAEADLGIGASGSTSWERCCLGLPSICVSVAENQEELGFQLHRKDAIAYIGRASEKCATEWHNAISTHVRGAWLRTTSTKAFSLVDGLGCGRVADTLFK